MKQYQAKAGAKIFFGLLGAGAIITEIVVLIGRGAFNPANFFSYFTILSNLLAVIILCLSGALLLKGKTLKQLTYIRGAATLYMAMTGVVFAVLLSGIEGGNLTAVPWDNTVLHYILPIVMVFDWYVDPPAGRPTFYAALGWLYVPLGYVAYTLTRGSAVGWYPYPFLNPGLEGVQTVTIVSICIAVLSVGIIWLLTSLPRKKKR